MVHISALSRFHLLSQYSGVVCVLLCRKHLTSLRRYCDEIVLCQVYFSKCRFQLTLGDADVLGLDGGDNDDSHAPRSVAP